MNPKTLIASALFIGAACVSASGSIIHHTELTNGLSGVAMSKDGLGINAATSVRMFKSKTTNGTTGVGVSGGAVDGEIDGDETITFSFAMPVFITALQVGQLYTDGNFGDIGDEAARFETSVGSFTLVADTATAALWNGLGSVSNISIANNSGGGEWRIEGADIFGGAITELTLRSGSPGGQAKFGDFTFVELSYAAVPTPGAISLAALGGLVVVRRRRA